jgi:hypothetical protein
MAQLTNPGIQPAYGSIESELTRSFNSFSGSDIRAVIGNIPFAEIQAISYSVTREKAPVYTMGSPDPRAFSRNKRGVAGSLIWINFDRHALLNVVRKAGGKFIANIDDIKPEYRNAENAFLGQSDIFSASVLRSAGIPLNIPSNEAQGLIPMTSVSSFKEEASPWYSDQILPFDITLAGTNEVGAATAMKIFGVEILNEGSGISIDDAVSETQATFVARTIEPWQAVISKFNPANLPF